MNEQERRRIDEHRKYARIYSHMPQYRMGGVRRTDAQNVLRNLSAGTLCDVGCGRGEMVEFAFTLGFQATGVEVVPELCDGHCVIEGHLPHLPFDDGAFDHVTCFDVMEHLPIGDEVLALRELGRIARKTVTVTANNYPSKDPRTGADLHINIRPYEEWFEVIAGVFGAERVQVLPSEYRSETFQVTL